MIPSKQALITSRDRIAPYIHQTPVHSSEMINEIIGAKVFFKCENFQKMGAFKMRGASNAILKLTSEQRNKGVTTHSSGNFAQAVALSSKLTNTNATIVMPSNAPEVKKKAVLGYGATVIDCEPTLKSREETAQKVVNDLDATLLHPYNCYDVIAGNASATLELMEQTSGLDIIFAPVGGGGLISGTALAAHYFSQIKVYGAEPLGADDAHRSFKSGKLIPMTNPNTIADGLRTSLGDKGFEIIKEHVSDIFTVEEKDITNAMQLVWERMKLIIEPSSAVPLAALINQKDKFKDQKVGIIISGGNVDLKHNYFI